MWLQASSSLSMLLTWSATNGSSFLLGLTLSRPVLPRNSALSTLTGTTFVLVCFSLVFNTYAYFITAAVARKIYLRGGLGVGRLRKVYGGNKRRGHRPDTFGKASGSILRHVVKQLESIGVVEKAPDGYVFHTSLCPPLLFPFHLWHCDSLCVLVDVELHKKVKEILTELPVVPSRLPIALKLQSLK